jgi:hypothetical protein
MIYYHVGFLRYMFVELKHPPPPSLLSQRERICTVTVDISRQTLPSRGTVEDCISPFGMIIYAKGPGFPALTLTF